MTQRLKILEVICPTTTQRHNVIDLRCRATACSAHWLLSQHHETPSRPGAIVASCGCAGSCLWRSIGSRQVMSCWSMIWYAVGHLTTSWTSVHPSQRRPPRSFSEGGVSLGGAILIVSHARASYVFVLCICIMCLSMKAPPTKLPSTAVTGSLGGSGVRMLMKA